MIIAKLIFIYATLQYLTNNFWMSAIGGLGLVTLDTLIAEIWDYAKLHYFIDIVKGGIRIEVLTKHDNDEDASMVA